MDQDRKESLVQEIEEAKREIRAGAKRGISDGERDQHLACALKQLSFAIGMIQIDHIFEQAFGSEASMRA